MIAMIEFPEWLRETLVTLGPIELFGREWTFPIRWYALGYIAGLLIGWRYIIRLIRDGRLWAPKTAGKEARGAPAVTAPRIDDFFLWALIGVMAGGRLGYVLFYGPEMIWTDPVRILRVWEGGMSFHGGMIGVTLAGLWFAHRHRIGALRLGDVIAPAAPIGIFLVRLANFANAELWGRPTDAPWGVVFCNDHLRAAYGFCPAGELPRHPSQLYEAALEGIVLFVVLLIAVRTYRSLTRPGLNTGLFLAGYSVSRILVEFVREPDAHLANMPLGLTMGMLLSLPMAAIGAWLIARAMRRPPVYAPPAQT